MLIGWLFFICVADDITGNLGKLGQIRFKDYRKQEKLNYDEIAHPYWCNNQEIGKFKMAFMGDSFVNETPFPQFLSELTKHNSTILVSFNLGSSEQSFISLCNTNETMPQIVILESVERDFVNRLSMLDFGSETRPEPLEYSNGKSKQTDFFTFYKNNILKNPSLFWLPLTDSLFSCHGKEKELLFHTGDLYEIEESVTQTAISKLDSLFQFAQERDITLFYVVAADKYDVYQEFVEGNVYPSKSILDAFTGFERNPYFVNTKDILLKKARQGVTDLYYADDTHWSPIGAKIVAEEIARRIDSLGIFKN